MGCLGLILIVLIVLPIVFILIFFNLIPVSFAKLGLSPEVAVALLLAVLLGSMVNIPISRRKIVYEQPRPIYLRFFFYLPPRVTHQVIAVNLGGALIPVGLALYVLPRAPLLPTLIATGVLVLATKFLAKPVSGVGIVMPAWIPPLIAVGLAFLLSRDNPAPVAYISGTVGTLIGADLLNWPNFKKLGAQLISIGGAGVFDGIFLTGIIAVLIT